MSLEKDRIFEERLRTAQPNVAGKKLSQDIQLALLRVERQRRFAHFRVLSGWAGLAVAASVLITVGVLLFNGRLAFEMGPQAPNLPIETTSKKEVPVEDSYRPILAENNLKGKVDEGIVFLRNGLTARRYRYEFIDRVVWENPLDGSLVEMQVPRDEVVLIPVQTF